MSKTTDNLANKLFVGTWGMEKTAELALLGTIACSVTVMVGSHHIPNNPTISDIPDTTKTTKKGSKQI